MDILLVIIGLLFVLLGMIGSFLPILPGPLTGWVGLLILHSSKAVPMNGLFLGICLAIAVTIWLIDYLMPALGAKKMGGTRYGSIGTMLGLLAGILFLGPFGILIGPFVGAFAGEMIKDATDTSRALQAALGSLVGFLASVVLKFGTSLVFAILFIRICWQYRATLLGMG
ncbi:MAG: DUF456 domain-containing protein [Lutibacter sp.]|jgi:hypothetical protein|nr:DUF456 domain-containing protein [Lutibacter sp.]